jgi:uncharacterized protein YcbX
MLASYDGGRLRLNPVRLQSPAMASAMAHLSRLSATPVKGLALTHPDAVELTLAGIPGNRRFYLIDERGELFSAFDHGPLVSIIPTYHREEEWLSLRFPDGGEVEGDAHATGRRVSTNFYGRRVTGRLAEGPWSAAVTTFVGTPLRLVRTDRDGDGTDVEHLTIVSTASIADLGARGHHDGSLDARRFRIDVEVVGTTPYEEDSWQGQRVGIGDATIRVLGQIPRCRVTTQSPQTGVRDWNTLTQIARYRPRIPGDGGIPFGMYARVERPGKVAVGDPVALMPREASEQPTG